MSHYTPRELPLLIAAKYNNTASALVKGVCVKMSQSVDEEIVLAETAKTDVIFGVTREAIPAYGWGDILVQGLAVVLAGGTFTQGKRLTVTTGGKVIDATPTGGDTNSIAGVSNRDGTDTFLTEMWLTGPGSSIQTED